MPNCKEVTLVDHKWPWRLIVMDRKVPDEEEKKNPTKKKSSSGCLVCFFYRCSWYSVTITGPRQQRIHEVISYIKALKYSILQVNTFCCSILQINAYVHIRALNYEHGMTDSRIILHNLPFFRCPGIFVITMVCFLSLKFLIFAKYTQLNSTGFAIHCILFFFFFIKQHPAHMCSWYDSCWFDAG